MMQPGTRFITRTLTYVVFHYLARGILSFLIFLYCFMVFQNCLLWDGYCHWQVWKDPVGMSIRLFHFWYSTLSGPTGISTEVKWKVGEAAIASVAMVKLLPYIPTLIIHVLKTPLRILNMGKKPNQEVHRARKVSNKKGKKDTVPSPSEIIEEAWRDHLREKEHKKRR